jgi:hypothetical protein
MEEKRSKIKILKIVMKKSSGNKIVALRVL